MCEDNDCLETEVFDCEKVLDEQIIPLVEQLVTLCREHKIPMFAAVTFKSDGKFMGNCISVVNDLENRYIGPIDQARRAFNTPLEEVEDGVKGLFDELFRGKG